MRDSLSKIYLVRKALDIVYQHVFGGGSSINKVKFTTEFYIVTIYVDDWIFRGSQVNVIVLRPHHCDAKSVGKTHSDVVEEPEY